MYRSCPVSYAFPLLLWALTINTARRVEGNIEVVGAVRSRILSCADFIFLNSFLVRGSAFAIRAVIKTLFYRVYFFNFISNVSTQVIPVLVADN